MKLKWMGFFLSTALMTQTQTLMAAAETAGKDEAATSVTQISEELKPKAISKFHVLINLETSSNMYRETSVDREASTDLLLSPSYQLSELYSLAAKSVISKATTGARNTTLSNTSVTLGRKGMALGPNASLSHSISAIMPTNEEARSRDRLQGAVAVGTGIKFHFLNVPSEYSVSLQKNFHEYMVNAESSPNVAYSIRHDLAFEIALSSKLSLAPSGYYRSGQTYHNYDRNNYGLGLDLSYKTEKELILYVGTGNEGPAYKANGTESNIKAYDQNTSVLRAGLSYTY